MNKLFARWGQQDPWPLLANMQEVPGVFSTTSYHTAQSTLGRQIDGKPKRFGQEFTGGLLLSKSRDGINPHAPPLTAEREVDSGAFLMKQFWPSKRKWLHSGLARQTPPHFSPVLATRPMSWPKKSQLISHLTPLLSLFQWSLPER